MKIGDKIIVIAMALENRSVYEVLNIDGDILMIEDEYLYINEVRLATPQEIQCGHRLPSVEVLRDCDIPPCTIILER